MRFNDIQAACIRSDERRNNSIENLSKYHRLIDIFCCEFGLK